MTLRKQVLAALTGLNALFAAGALTAGPAAAQQAAVPKADVVEYPGTVAAAREAEVSPRIDGLLLKIHFATGQEVKEGDLLFEFGTTDKELSLSLANARLKQAEAQLRLAEVKLDNTKALRTRNVGSEMQLTEAQAQRDLAAAQADEARANVQLAELALSQMKLDAPISGIIGRPQAAVGTYITKEARDKSRLATIVQLDPILVVGRIISAASPTPPPSGISRLSCRAAGNTRMQAGLSLATMPSMRLRGPSR